MNTFRSMVCVSLALGMFCSAAVAADSGACAYSAASRVSWVESLARQLHIHDPGHAEQMSKVASEILTGKLDMLKTDINAGLDPNALLKLGPNPLSDMSLLTLAVSACQDSVVRELVASGAAVNGGVGASTPLVIAAAKGEVPLVKFLIQHGATVDKVDENGHSALEDAVRQHQLGAVQVLLVNGSNPNRDVGGGSTIFDIVAGSSDSTSKAIAKELRAYGAGSTAKRD